MENIFKEMEQAIIDGDKESSVRLAQKAIEANIDPAKALEKGYAKGLKILGNKFENQEVYLPELLFVEEAMYAALEVLKPKIDETNLKTKGRKRFL